MSKKPLNIGVIGHIDHGKTTLTHAITKVMETNNLKYVGMGSLEESKSLEITNPYKDIDLLSDHLKYEVCDTDYGGEMGGKTDNSKRAFEKKINKRRKRNKNKKTHRK